MIKDIFCFQGTMPEIEKRKLFFDKLPAEMEEKRLLFASDFHYGGMMNHRRMTRLIDSMTALKPDIIMLGGDYADDIKEETAFIKDHLSRLKAPYGVYCVPGNNDWETVSGQYDRLRGLFAQAGAVFLVNERAKIKVGEARIVVSGIDDCKRGRPSKKSLARGYDKDAFNVLLSHSPAVLDRILDEQNARFQLVLCGHTHGGQIRVGPLSPYTIGFESKLRTENRYFFVNGEHDVDGMKIIVSNGIGCSILPIRVGAPPQIHLFTLKVRK